jgi:hypothetical protein
MIWLIRRFKTRGFCLLYKRELNSHEGFGGEKGQDAPRVIVFLGGKILELTVFLNKKWLLKHQSFCSHVFKDVF